MGEHKIITSSMIPKKKKMGLKKKNYDITQGNNENKRGVVRTMQTKVKESTAQ